jgi:pre-mRNA-splicing factor ATP-dependent RNA helicase DHX38/PRP16
MWEENRLLQSGVVRRTSVNEEEEKDLVRVQIIVMDIKPPFLDGRMVTARPASSLHNGTALCFRLLFVVLIGLTLSPPPTMQVHTRRQDQANLVKDPTGDMSKISMKGSNLLREYREKRDQHRGRQRFWEMKGSAMGNAIGIVDDGNPEDATEAAKFDRPMADGEEGAEKHFGELLKAKNVARSDFSRSKTMAQQRQALPIFACKDSILRAVRENSVVVVEGETGSGKTTQLVQFMHEAGYTKLGKIGCTQVRLFYRLFAHVCRNASLLNGSPVVLLR